MKIPYLLLPTLGTNKPSYSPASILKLIITALRQEARPIIKNLGLKHDPASRKIPIYSAGDTLLAISGIGKVSAGIATTHAYHLAKNSSSFQLYNIGVCGAAVDRFSLGQALTVNKIWDPMLQARSRFSKPLLIGTTEFGALNTLIHIWPYESLERRAAIRAQAVEAGVWPPPTAPQIQQMRTMIMLPASFSPLQ